MVWGFYLIINKQFIAVAFYTIGLERTTQISILKREAKHQIIFVGFITTTHTDPVNDLYQAIITEWSIGVCRIKSSITRTGIVDNNTAIALIGDINRIAWETQLVVL